MSAQNNDRSPNATLPYAVSPGDHVLLVFVVLAEQKNACGGITTRADIALHTFQVFEQALLLAALQSLIRASIRIENAVRIRTLRKCAINTLSFYQLSQNYGILAQASPALFPESIFNSDF